MLLNYIVNGITSTVRRKVWVYPAVEMEAQETSLGHRNVMILKFKNPPRLKLWEQFGDIWLLACKNIFNVFIF